MPARRSARLLPYSVPPGYQRTQPARKPKLGPWVGIIDAILREEDGYTGGYTAVKDYVRRHKLRGQEMYVPLTIERSLNKTFAHGPVSATAAISGDFQLQVATGTVAPGRY